jgi:hypothetical protein
MEMWSENANWVCVLRSDEKTGMLMESVMDAVFLCISETSPSSFRVRDLTQRKI